MMNVVIWSGAGLSLLGLVGLLWTIWKVFRLKRAKTDDQEMRAAMAKLLPINLAALFLSIIGLMAVVIGILLA